MTDVRADITTFIMSYQTDEGTTQIVLESKNGEQLNEDLVRVLKSMGLQIQKLQMDKRKLELQLKAAKAVKNQEIFKWHKCTRKNGTEFLKLIYYSPNADGYVEAGRFNMNNHELVQNEWSLNEILKELI